MKKYNICTFLLSLVLMTTLLPVPVSALEAPDLHCRNAILLDVNYGEILYEKNAQDRAYPASLTKVMTALLVMEAIDAGTLSASTPVTADSSLSRGLIRDASSVGIKPGHTLTVEQLLYCLLLPSANEAANILAVAVDGSIDDFVDHMNRRATSLGCKGTHFMNPHGLHDNDHYSTAYDLALMMQEALKHDLFRAIIDTPKYTIPANDNHPEFYFFNTNGLISNLYYMNYVYDKCIGGKTGSTPEAGRCLIAAAESGDDFLVSVILGSGVITDSRGKEVQGQFTESTKLLKWGFKNFRRITITQDLEPVETVKVTLSRETDQVMVKPQGSITRTLPVDVKLDDMERKISLFSPTVEAPVQEGQVLGTMTLSYQNEVYGTLDLVAVTSVARSELLYKKAQFIEFFQNFWVKLLVGAVVLFGLGLTFYLLVVRKKRRYRPSSGRRQNSYRGFSRR